jgi:hypothetical protein
VLGLPARVLRGVLWSTSDGCERCLSHIIMGMSGIQTNR